MFNFKNKLLTPVQ